MSSILQPSWNNRAIETELDAFLKQKQRSARAIDASYSELLAQIRTLVGRGGKRVRPYLVELSYRGYGGQGSNIVRVAASQELFHAFLLMHDDIIDRDHQRWGGPNIAGHYHKLFSSKLTASRAHHYSQAWAMLAGDVCSSLSNELLLASNFPAEDLLACQQLVQHTLFEVLGGELTDIALPLFTQPGTVLPRQQLLAVCRYKTATYSFCTPLQIGGLLAGASPTQQHVLKQFGLDLGTAFQLRDDLLGMLGNAPTLGKPVGSDLREGKQTVLMRWAFMKASATDRNTLIKLFGKADLTAQELHDAQTIITTCGAVSQTEKLIDDYSQKAQTKLAKLTMHLQAKHDLAALISFCRQRSY